MHIDGHRQEKSALLHKVAIVAADEISQNMRHCLLRAYLRTPLPHFRSWQGKA